MGYPSNRDVSPEKLPTQTPKQAQKPRTKRQQDKEDF